MTVPLSLTGRYQLVVLGQEGDSRVSECASRLVNAINLAFRQLGVNSKKFLVHSMPGTSGPDLDRRMPAVAVFFGFVPSPSLSASDTKKLDCLLTDGVLIIPVVENITNFSG